MIHFLFMFFSLSLILGLILSSIVFGVFLSLIISLITVTLYFFSKKYSFIHNVIKNNIHPIPQRITYIDFLNEKEFLFGIKFGGPKWFLKNMFKLPINFDKISISFDEMEHKLILLENIFYSFHDKKYNLLHNFISKNAKEFLYDSVNKPILFKKYNLLFKNLINWIPYNKQEFMKNLIVEFIFLNYEKNLNEKTHKELFLFIQYLKSFTNIPLHIFFNTFDFKKEPNLLDYIIKFSKKYEWSIDLPASNQLNNLNVHTSIIINYLRVNNLSHNENEKLILIDYISLNDFPYLTSFTSSLNFVIKNNITSKISYDNLSFLYTNKDCYDEQIFLLQLLNKNLFDKIIIDFKLDYFFQEKILNDMIQKIPDDITYINYNIIYLFNHVYYLIFEKLDNKQKHYFINYLLINNTINSLNDEFITYFVNNATYDELSFLFNNSTHNKNITLFTQNQYALITNKYLERK